MSAREIRLAARNAAFAYGYRTGTDGNLYAPPGKFESEPYYILYFYDAMMEGDGEPLYSDENYDGTMFDVTADEREAFELDAGTVAVVLWCSDQGFRSLQELSEIEYAGYTL